MINPVDDRVYVWYPSRIRATGILDVANLEAKASCVAIVLGYERHPLVFGDSQRSIVDTDVGLIACHPNARSVYRADMHICATPRTHGQRGC